MFRNNNKAWKKTHTRSCSGVTLGSYDGAEIWELAGIHIVPFLVTILDRSNLWLHRDDYLWILGNVNGQQIYQMHKNIIKSLKDVGFGVNIKTNKRSYTF